MKSRVVFAVGMFLSGLFFGRATTALWPIEQPVKVLSVSCVNSDGMRNTVHELH